MRNHCTIERLKCSAASLSVLVEATFFCSPSFGSVCDCGKCEKGQGCASPALTFATKKSRKDKLYLYDIDFDTDIVVDTNTQQIQIIMDIEIEI